MTRLGPVPNAPLTPCTCGTWLCPECAPTAAPTVTPRTGPAPAPIPATYALELDPTARAAVLEGLLCRIRRSVRAGWVTPVLPAIDAALGPEATR